jgi:alginate O-acetyltransferase complex protein AlgI
MLALDIARFRVPALPPTHDAAATASGMHSCPTCPIAGPSRHSQPFPQMLFNSQPFLVLLLITFGLFYLPALRRFQTQVLILASLVFYAWESPVLLILLCLSVVFNASVSYAIVLRGKARTAALVFAAVVFNLLLLGFFKYAGFFTRLIVGPESDSAVYHFLVTIPLPIGISFYTFEGISLVIDIMRSPGGRPAFVKNDYRSHLSDTALFVSFFPHLISGPILKARDFYPQIREKHFRDIPWQEAFQAIVIGYFLKLVVADNMKDLTELIRYPDFLALPAGHLVALLFGYSIQIFADFAGYSIIAVGLALLFGYRIINNFNFPYIADSLADFWKRWHISLSQWLRDYLYIPLGGNRRGKGRTYFNLLTVMVLGGLWHGAASVFALWGLYHGLGLAAERWCADALPARAPKPALRPLRMAVVFLFVTLGWLLFKLTRLDHVQAYFSTIAGNWSVPSNPGFLCQIAIYSAPVILYHLWHLSGRRVPAAVAARLRPVALGAMLAAVFLNSGTQGRFIYFQF